jgi:uncharacterized OB-fold protein
MPVPDEQSAPFWESAAAGVLVLARCGRCNHFAHPPAPVCPHCGHTDPAFAFEPVEPRGRICSWTVIRQSFAPGFDADVPFVLADVEIDGTEVRLIGRLVDGPDVLLQLGDPVRVVFERIDDGIAVPAFAVAAE